MRMEKIKIFFNGLFMRIYNFFHKKAPPKITYDGEPKKEPENNNSQIRIKSYNIKKVKIHHGRKQLSSM